MSYVPLPGVVGLRELWGGEGRRGGKRRGGEERGEGKEGEERGEGKRVEERKREVTCDYT